ncbi:MAG TPA: hypothetical protein VF576_03850 [Rubricoccaceae bacterium]
MRFRLALLLLCPALAACGPDAEGPRPPPAPVVPAVRARPLAAPRPPRPDSLAPPPPPAPVVFDTTEPPEAVQNVQPRPPPRPPPPPRGPAAPPPAPPRPPGGSGSCDVRATENYCFAYTGPGWTPETAGLHCDAAPEATFGAGPCPTAGRIATCTFRRPSDPSHEIVYTTYAPADLSLARLACPGAFETFE